MITLRALAIACILLSRYNEAEAAAEVDFAGGLKIPASVLDPTFRNQVQNRLRSQNRRHLQPVAEDSFEEEVAIDEEEVMVLDEECETRDLAEFPQWEAEEGYWIGEYSFYGSDGAPFNSSAWNYRYDAYKGFITGNVEGSSYRQRNVFLYPPQYAEECEVRDDVVGNGTCGVNGNTRLFFADQTAINGTCDGSISGDFAGIFDTTTDLIGRDNAVLYQVFFKDSIPGVGGKLFQSQLTTLTEMDDGRQLRTRSAQGFATTGEPQSVSFYRERKASEEDFYEELQATIEEYGILESDTCAWMDDFDGSIVSSGGEPGFDRCVEHLEESFKLEG